MSLNLNTESIVWITLAAFAVIGFIYWGSRELISQVGSKVGWALVLIRIGAALLLLVVRCEPVTRLLLSRTAPANLVLLKNCSIVGVFWGAWTERHPDLHRKNMDIMFQWLREEKLRPNISHHFPLEEVPAALNVLVERKVVGKAVITVD